MALVVYWYDLFCFGIVGAAIVGALWLIWRNERSGKSTADTKYESLLPSRPEDDEVVGIMHPSHVSSSMLWMSCWRGVHPGVLLLTRLTSALVMAGFLVWDLVTWGVDIFTYYTEYEVKMWTFSLIIIYFLVASIVSGHGCWTYSKRQKHHAKSGFLRGNEVVQAHEQGGNRSGEFGSDEHGGEANIKLQSNYEREEREGRAGLGGYVMQAIFQACGGAVMLTDIVFWGLIVPFLKVAHFSLTPLMGCMHSLNLAFLLLDISLCSLPFPWFRMSYFVLWSCVYIIFQWVIHACGYSEWPYSFLELSTPWAVLWYFALALLHIPCFALFVLIIKVKNVGFSKLFPHSFIRPC